MMQSVISMSLIVAFSAGLAQGQSGHVPIHTAEGDFEAKKAQWGVKALPWLILADRQHAVRQEGVGVDTLGQRLESLTGK